MLRRNAHSIRCVSAHVGIGKQGALVTVEAGVHDDVQQMGLHNAYKHYVHRTCFTHDADDEDR